MIDTTTFIISETRFNNTVIFNNKKATYVYFLSYSVQTWHLKGKKRQRFRIIHLIEFIQTNNFHIYLIFLPQRFTQNVTLKSKNLTKSMMA